MDSRTCSIVFLILSPIFIGAWKASREERKSRDLGKGNHHQFKRHMLLSEGEVKRRSTTQRIRDVRKKPSGHLTPLEEDDMDSDAVVSVAIGPPPIRPKVYDKGHWQHPPKPATTSVSNVTTANLVKDVLTQLGRELLSREVSEDFVFGQYVGNAMKNLTIDLRLKMQHEILELIVMYQKVNRGDNKTDDRNNMVIKEFKMDRKLLGPNETDEMWPDFTNLAKIVG